MCTESAFELTTASMILYPLVQVLLLVELGEGCTDEFQQEGDLSASSWEMDV